MQPGICKLCRGIDLDLQESHVVPAFVFRWMKETSATGHIRFGQRPNKRVQDGEKRYWLCTDCELRLCSWETKFASEVFYPLIKDGGQQISYGDWLMKFCVSVSWRVLSLMKEENALGRLNEKQMIAVERALEIWSGFLMDRQQNPASYEQHFLPLDVFASSVGGSVPTNINRYILRAVDVQVASQSEDVIVYTKFTKFILVGFIRVRYPARWKGTKLHVGKGFVGCGRYELPSDVGEFIFSRAQRYAELYSEISEKQQAKIRETMLQDLDRVHGSLTLEALQHDVDLFGDSVLDQLGGGDR